MTRLLSRSSENSSFKFGERVSINSFILKNNDGQLVQVRPSLCRAQQKSFLQGLFRINKSITEVVFVGNLETAQTKAVNRRYYEKVLKLTQNKRYKLQKVVYNKAQDLLEEEFESSDFLLSSSF